MSDKSKMVRQSYYDPDGGLAQLMKFIKTHHILNTITVHDVKEFLSRQKSRQTKSYRGFNNYVAKEPLREIQIDFADFITSADVNDGCKYCFVAVDVFTKICHAIPIENKKPKESVRAMREVLNKISVPEIIYHDNEDSWNSTQFIRLVSSHKIKQIITPTPPPFAKRMVQTIKNMIHTRLEGLEIKRNGLKFPHLFRKNIATQNLQPLVSVLMKQLNPVIIWRYG